ncbi:hypothetical protein E2C01_098297 [Portunus trituberculatus]|uniref:Uncharacterized protein n=1 Tax=Portunus trituberculatus TaxID=210409 RepID=A0A5B7K6P6_PORTR|nr:hypothetical protein [Portunus trituberculatus]
MQLMAIKHWNTCPTCQLQGTQDSPSEKGHSLQPGETDMRHTAGTEEQGTVIFPLCATLRLMSLDCRCFVVVVVIVVVVLVVLLVLRYY